MNTKTGKVYEDDAAVKRAKARGETLVEVEPAVAKRLQLDRLALLNMKQALRRIRIKTREQAKKTRTRRRERVAKANRKRNQNR